jgi:hypothetical protein
MTEPAKTYTRIEAAEIFGVSNTIVRRNLKAILEFGFDASLLLTSDNRLTERASELIRLYREKNQATLDAALGEELASDSLQSDMCDTPAETELFGEYPAAPAGSFTLASQCQVIADRTGTITATSSEPYEQRAAAARSALSQFIATNNARASQLASNAVATRRSFEQLGQEHAIGHLMTYAESMNRTLAEGMAAMQNGAVNMADRMGNAAAADMAS